MGTAQADLAEWVVCSTKQRPAKIAANGVAGKISISDRVVMLEVAPVHRGLR